jgi:hypothetical protein
MAARMLSMLLMTTNVMLTTRMPIEHILQHNSSNQIKYENIKAIAMHH